MIVDVFVQIRGNTDPKADRYQADYLAISALKDLADEYGVAVLVVHHTRKASADDFIDTVSGTNGLSGAADAVLQLTRSRNTKQAVLKLVGRDVEEAEYPMELDASLGLWAMLDGPATDYDLGDTRRRILEYVREHDGATPTQIAEATGMNPNTVKVNVRRMVDDQQLDTDGSGHYLAPLQPVTHVTEETQGDNGYDGYSEDERNRARARAAAASE